MKEKFILKILVLIVVMAVFGMGGNAVSEPYDFVINSDTGTIVRYTGSASEVDVPAEINGVKVKAIDFALFCGRDELTSINLPDGIISIGNSAFSRCKNLTDINIPDSVKFIGVSAFSGCSNLKSVSIPNSVIGIGESAFEDCGLTGVIIPTGLQTIKSNTFRGCRNLKDVIILPGIEVIESGAFYGCSSLTDISVPPGVQTIYYNAFSGCSALTRISIPNSVTYIESAVFSPRGNELTILSKDGSVAQNYAKNNEINFMALPYTRLVGTLEPDFQCMGNAKIKDGFLVEIAGQSISTYTDISGKFELNIPESVTGLEIKISKPGYLAKELKGISIGKRDFRLSPLSIWAGDMNGDHVINMADIMEVAKGFNTSKLEEQYMAHCDFNKDGAINIIDIMIVARHFNVTGY